MSRISIPRRRPSAGTVIALVALFVALGGPAEAARLLNGSTIKKNSIPGDRLKKGTVRGTALRANTIPLTRIQDLAVVELRTTPPGEVDVSKLADGAVNSDKVADRTLRGDDLADRSVGAAQVVDGDLAGRDVGSFVGSATFDFGTIAVGECKEAEAQAAEVPPGPRDMRDDVIVVTPEVGLSPAGSEITYDARATSPSTIGVTICNHNTNPLAIGQRQFRYLSVDVVG